MKYTDYMHHVKIKTDPAFSKRFDQYPPAAREKMRRLRELVHESLCDQENVTEIEETLKWGEPSFITRHGSTLRMDWKERAPDQYAVYFKCTSKLVPTFKKVFDGLFRFEKDRAIVFTMDDIIPEPELKQCIAATLDYHNVKHLPNLGMKG